MKTIIFAVVMVGLLLGSNGVFAEGAHAKKHEKAIKAQTKCPVMGGKINKKFYADVKGKRIYVCCPGCISKIKKTPDKYIKKLEKGGVTLEKTPKKEEAAHKKEGHNKHEGHKHHLN